MKTFKDPHEKALEFNQDQYSYGSFAEIGAGQEVARWFFRVGGASKTIAKTMSAYDMTFSDSIYGAEKNKRYVCESRLLKMLNHEYDLLIERLSEVRDPKTKYFVFADTVTTRRGSEFEGGHGWLGVRIHDPNTGKHSDLIIHIRCIDHRTLEQQEAIGIVGVNLLHAAYFYSDNPQKLVESLTDGLDRDGIEVDMIRSTGPMYDRYDSKLLSLYLVECGLTDAVLFSPSGTTVQPSEAFFGKNLLVQRGRFHPPTHLHLDMLNAGMKQFQNDYDLKQKDILVLMELTVNTLQVSGKVDGKNESRVDTKDTIERVHVINGLGNYALVSNYARYYRLSDFIAKYSNSKVGVVTGVAHMKEIFNSEYYDNVPGGIMEALGRLFGKNVSAYVYPAYSLDFSRPFPKDEKDLKLIHAKDLEFNDQEAYLFRHLYKNGHVRDVTDFDIELLKVNSEELLAQIRSGDPAWKAHVPDVVAEIIDQFGYFGATKQVPKKAA